MAIAVRSYALVLGALALLGCPRHAPPQLDAGATPATSSHQDAGESHRLKGSYSFVDMSGGQTAFLNLPSNFSIISRDGTTAFIGIGPCATNTLVLGQGSAPAICSTYTIAAPGTSGNVLKSDGTNWTSSASAAGSWHTITLAPGTANWTSTLTGTIIATWAGGGGGGAGGDGSTGSAQKGGGGGGGAQSIPKYIDVTLGQQYDLTYGSGGTGGTGGAAGGNNRGGGGGNGTDSTFVIHAGATLATWPGAGGAPAPALNTDGGTNLCMGGADTRITQQWTISAFTGFPQFMPPGYGGITGTSSTSVSTGSSNADATFSGGLLGGGAASQGGAGGGGGATGVGGGGAAAVSGTPSPGSNAAAGTSAGGGGGAASTTAGNAGSNGGNGGSAGSLTIRSFY